MKKLLIVLIFCFNMLHAESITFTFANGQITGTSPKYYEFDVMATGNTGSTKLGDCLVYINYNTIGFGSNIVGNTKVTVTKGSLVNTIRYNDPIINDNTSSTLSIQIEFPSELEIDANTLPASASQWAHIKIEIANQSQTAGLSFNSALMSGQEFEYNNTTLYNPVTAADTDDSSLPVQMSGMEAESTVDGIVLTWETASEVNSLGLPVAMMWIDTTLAGFMSGVQMRKMGTMKE